MGSKSGLLLINASFFFLPFTRWDLFKGSGTGAYLTIEEAEGYSVPVAVWSVTRADVARLDWYEGFPTHYFKKELSITYSEIFSEKKRNAQAFMYIMQEGRALGKPTRDYLNTCREGYCFFGFDCDVLLGALYASSASR